MAVVGSVKSNGAGFRITVDPTPKEIAKQIATEISRPMAKKVGELHKRFGDIPISEIKSRSQSMGSGRRHIGRSVKLSASRAELLITGGSGFPDFAGQEWGSKRWPQFLPYNPDGYVIGEMMSDGGFLEDLLERYADGLGELIDDVWNE